MSDCTNFIEDVIKIYPLDACEDGSNIRIFIPGPPGPPGVSRVIKSGIVSGSSFTGNPKTYSVLFSTSFSNTNYSISISGEDGRIYTYESKSSSGFTINANAESSLIGEVSWTAIASGETP